MKRLSFFILTVFVVFNQTARAQDTLYLDENNKQTSPENAVYTKVVTKTDSVYSVKQYKKENLLSVQEYKDGDLKILHGRYVHYYENGRPDSEGWYDNKNRAGDWTFYYDNQQIAGLVSFKDGKIVKAIYYSKDGSIEPASRKVEVMPVFPGGINNYVRENLRYPKESRKNKVSGTVKVAFTVSRMGKVIDAKVISGINEELDTEALRVIREMPDWQPGIQFNRPVNVRYVLPIAFTLNRQ